MKKFGGFLLMGIGILLILIAVARAINVSMIFMDSGASAYGIGFIAGTLIMLILFSALGIKAFKKGRTLVNTPAATLPASE